METELEDGNNAYEVFMEGQYEVGDVVGTPLSWGVWVMRTGKIKILDMVFSPTEY